MFAPDLFFHPLDLSGEPSNLRIESVNLFFVLGFERRIALGARFKERVQLPLRVGFPRVNLVGMNLFVRTELGNR